MYFEPSKRNYYRFPSTNRMNDFEAKYNFPEKSNHSEEDTRYDSYLAKQNTEQRKDRIF